MAVKIVNQILSKSFVSTSISDKGLLRHAVKALRFSYSPYSKFKVGAAVLQSNGAIILGANIENASYPLCLCAERTALAHAHMQSPSIKIQAIAIVCKSASQILSEPGYPCGACRQVISEFESKQKSPIKIIVGNVSMKNIQSFDSINFLLPYSFNGSFLKES